MNPVFKKTLQWTANLGLAAALMIGLFPVGMRAYGQWSQSHATDRFRERVTETSPARAAATPTGHRRPKTLPPRRAWETCILQIPSLGVDAVVTEGAGKWELVIGPGHVPQSAGPGGAGNCVIAAHRNMWDAAFAELPRLKKGDLLYLITPDDRFIYQVDDSREIKTREKGPLRDTKTDARLTLVTCVLPFDSGRRWVVQAHLVEDPAG